MRIIGSAIVLISLGSIAVADAGAPLSLERASLFGTSGDDDIQSACVAPDGTIYIAGNTGISMKQIPGGAALSRLGDGVDKPMCGHGFVARLSSDGGRVLAYAEFGKGVLSLTTVQANAKAVYVAGYATRGLEQLLNDVPGLLREYPLRKEIALLEAGQWREAVGEDTSKPDPIPESRHGQLGRYGAPCVLRLSADLNAVESGTYLEGWQQVWAKDRTYRRIRDPKTNKKRFIYVPTEFSWQPTHLSLLKSGDLVVCHDGGYFRLLTPEDRALVEKVGDPGLAKRLGFYDMCDHLTRLSSDLDRQAYTKRIYTPATNIAVAKRIKTGWPYPHYSSPRTHRMRLDRSENVYVCGWSASATSREPWWSPYVWQISASDGSVTRKILETDPMSGKDNRMGGAVADRAIGAIAVDRSNLFYSSYSDGGYSGLLHFSGTIFRTDKKTGAERAKAKTAPCFWTVDLAAMPGNQVLALGRCNGIKTWPEDAWQQGDPEEHPQAWLRVYSDKMEPTFTTAIRGVTPYALCELDSGRYMIVGRSHGTLQMHKEKEDGDIEESERRNPGVALQRGAIVDKPQGGDDGYFMIVKIQRR
jgi:hypothetical protein